jgi:hypothetical protein
MDAPMTYRAKRTFVALALVVAAGCGTRPGAADPVAGGGGGQGGGGGDGPGCDPSTSWQNVDDLSDMSADARPWGLGSAPGALFVAGSVAVGSSKRWMVRVTRNGGESWEVADDFQLFANEDASASRVAVAADGTIYVAGEARGADGLHRIVRRSTDGGAEWETIDDFQLEPGQDGFSTSLAINADGHVFAGGNNSDGVNWRYVMRSTTNGGDWDSSAEFQLEDGLYTAMYMSTFDDDTFYVAGNGVVVDEVYRWIALTHGADGEVSILDNFELSPGQNSAARGIWALPSGTLYAPGHADDAQSEAHWMLRRSTDAGASWETIDDYVASDAYAESIVMDRAGNLFVLGEIEFNVLPQASVRRSDDGGATWVNTDAYRHDDLPTYVTAAIAHEGDLYVSLAIIVSDTNAEWVIRRLDCQ